MKRQKIDSESNSDVEDREQDNPFVEGVLFWRNLWEYKGEEKKKSKQIE